MKKLFILSALVLGMAFTVNAQSRDPRKSSNPRETHQVNTNTSANSQRPSIAPKQSNSQSYSSSSSSSTRSTSSSSSSSNSSNDRRQRDAVNNGSPKYATPRK